MNDIHYAGFWNRFLASLLDTLFLALPLGVFIYFLSDGSWFDFSQYRQNIAYALSGNATKALASQPEVSLKWELLFEVTVLLATIAFWRKSKGATPGKKFVGIKVVDAITHQDIGTKQAITRSLGYFASIFTFMIGFIMVGFRKDKRGLHDLLANTIVIYQESPTLHS